MKRKPFWEKPVVARKTCKNCHRELAKYEGEDHYIVIVIGDKYCHHVWSRAMVNARMKALEVKKNA